MKSVADVPTSGRNVEHEELHERLRGRRRRAGCGVARGTSAGRVSSAAGPAVAARPPRGPVDRNENGRPGSRRALDHRHREPVERVPADDRGTSSAFCSALRANVAANVDFITASKVSRSSAQFQTIRTVQSSSSDVLTPAQYLDDLQVSDKRRARNGTSVQLSHLCSSFRTLWHLNGYRLFCASSRAVKGQKASRLGGRNGTAAPLLAQRSAVGHVVTQ